MTTATAAARPPFILSSYLDACFDPNTRRKIISNTVQALLPHRLEFDTIAFRGISGALVAPEVAQYLQKHLLLVRKGENRHSSYEVEGNLRTQKYVIVDDIVCSGDTIDAIRREIAEAQRRRDEPLGECFGIALYMFEREGREIWSDEQKERFGVQHVWCTKPPDWFSLP